MRQPLVIRRGRYELLLPLGEGRVTRAYLAVADGAQHPVVVKRLRPELAQDAQLSASFTAAAGVALQLDHPQIARTLDVFAEGNEQLLAMEYLEGETLADLVRRVGRSRMPIEEHLYVLSQALAGLGHCHGLQGPGGQASGGNHREASATNIVVTYDGEVKLVDFALQEAQVPGVGLRGAGPRGIGPFAPEQLCGLPIDARSDVFAMGILLWEALARRPRAVGDDRAALIAARVAGSEPGPEALPANLPRALIDTCARATALDPEARFAGPAEMAQALDQIRAGLPRVVGAPELAALVARNFKLDRDALRRRINEHLERARAAARLRTPAAPVAQAPGPRGDRDITMPGLVPNWFEPSSDEASHEPAHDPSHDLPALPWTAARRVGMTLLAVASVAVVIAVGSFVRRGDRPSAPVVSKLPAGTGRVASAGSGWQPIGSPAVALDRTGPPAARTGPAAAEKRVAPSSPAAKPGPAALRVAAPVRPRPRRASLSPLDAPVGVPLTPSSGATVATTVDLPRRTPVPLLDANGRMLSVPRVSVQPPPAAPAVEPGRSLANPVRRQLDEQDPYR